MSKTELLAQVSSFSDFEENWDGEGGRKIPANLIEDVLQFIIDLPEGDPLPFAAPGVDGSIALEWFSHALVLEFLEPNQITMMTNNDYCGPYNKELFQGTFANRSKSKP